MEAGWYLDLAATLAGPGTGHASKTYKCSDGAPPLACVSGMRLGVCVCGLGHLESRLFSNCCLNLKWQ